MGAWIETKSCFLAENHLLSRSLMGAWIETMTLISSSGVVSMSLPYGSVD